MTEHVSEHIEKLISSLKESCELTVKYEPEANLDQYLKMVEELTKVQISNRHSVAAFEAADEADSVDEFERIHRLFGDPKCDTATIKRQSIYKDFERFLRDLKNKKKRESNRTVTQTTVTNDEMEITDISTPSIDPITKGPLLRPVRNRHCKHIYGYQSVVDSLKLNRRLKCPMAGCGNRQYIVEEDLIAVTA